MSSDTHRTNGEQFAAMGYPSAYDSHHQQRPSSHYPNFATRPMLDSQGNASSTTQQQSAGQFWSSEMSPSQIGASGGGALGILADVALAGGGIAGISAIRPNMPQSARYEQPESVSTGMNGTVHPPVSHPTGPPPHSYFTPTTGEYRQSRPTELTATVPRNPSPWTASTNPTHPSYNQQPSIIETAASLQSIAMSGSSIRSQFANGAVTNSDSRNCSSSSSSTAAKRKSSYIISQMEKVDKVEKDSVGRVRDRTNYFASYAHDHEQHVVSSSSSYDVAEDSEEDAHVNGYEKSSGKEQESTRDRPGDKYVKMFEEPGQQRYEEAILGILDGMELPR